MAAKAVLSVVSGPNEGDSVTVEAGSCRIVGRHLSDSETALIDRDGNRILDGAAVNILEEHLQEKVPDLGVNKGFSDESFERGPDIILADDSISRAHAMIFVDSSGVGVIDLASTNGTFVNNERISTALCKDGDSIGLGSSDLVVKLR